MESIEKEFTDLMVEKIKKEETDKKEKIKTFKTRYSLIEILLTFIGYTILGYQNGWIAFGVFLITVGNNMSVFRSINRKSKSYLKEIWKDE